jgi:hypothetical protein
MPLWAEGLIRHPGGNWIKEFFGVCNPLSQVPDEAATLVRALLTADRNQQYLRSRMTEAQRTAQISNRIVLGVIAAAFINGLAVLVSVYRPPAWEKWAWVVFAFGFLCALLLGVYLAWTILRTKHG